MTSLASLAQIIARVTEAVSDAANLIPAYIKDHPEFEEVGGRMLSIWRCGLDEFSRSSSGTK